MPRLSTTSSASRGILLVVLSLRRATSPQLILIPDLRSLIAFLDRSRLPTAGAEMHRVALADHARMAANDRPLPIFSTAPLDRGIASQTRRSTQCAIRKPPLGIRRQSSPENSSRSTVFNELASRVGALAPTLETQHLRPYQAVNDSSRQRCSSVPSTSSSNAGALGDTRVRPRVDPIADEHDRLGRR